MKRNLPALLLVFIFLFYWVSVPVVFAAEPDKPGQGTGFGNTAADNDAINPRYLGASNLRLPLGIPRLLRFH